MPWIYDPKLKGSGYRDLDTGRILSVEAVRGLVDKAISAGQNETTTLANLVATNQLSPDDWEQRMRDVIKDNYITQYLSGVGGRERMTPEDWGSVGGMLADQYRYLGDFADGVDELSEGQIAMRAAMYINSSREAFERARMRTADERGYKEKAWIMTAAENCEDCQALNGLGYVGIEESFVSPSSAKEAVPGNGATLCLTNCKCYLDYRR